MRHHRFSQAHRFSIEKLTRLKIFKGTRKIYPAVLVGKVKNPVCNPVNGLAQNACETFSLGVRRLDSVGRVVWVP